MEDIQDHSLRKSSQIYGQKLESQFMKRSVRFMEEYKLTAYEKKKQWNKVQTSFMEEIHNHSLQKKQSDL